MASELPGDRPASLDWRPMAFGSRAARHVRDPIIEPLWSGRRVLAEVRSATATQLGSVELRDEEGMPLGGHAEIRAGLLAATRADLLILDGHLSPVPASGATGAFAGDAGPQAPGLATSARQLLFGSRRSTRGRDGPVRPDLGAGSPPIAPAAPLAFVAIDLLAIDEDSLLPIPLLERKRILDGALAEGDLVRLSPHVRPPVGPWYSQWRAFGFREIAVKAANSRYLPGEPSDEWAVALIPNA